MLELALNAGLPLIRVETDDTINFPDVLEQIAGEEVSSIAAHELPGLSSKMVANGRVFFSIEPEAMHFDQAYRICVENDKVLVVVNPEEDDAAMFNAGIVRLPSEMLEEFLSEIVPDDKVAHLMTALGGLSLKDVAEVCRLCTVMHGSLTPRGVMAVRRMYMQGLRGVQQVDTDYPFYKPEEKLDTWLSVSGKIFKRDDVPPELVPRGMLLGGEPGTGKTMAAKYLANKLEVPLFRLDLGGLMNKYVGESEGNLSQALAQVDAAEPCILLIDEVEKLFNSVEDSGVTSRLLSQLLWWLQEHTSRVLTVMTTNDKDALPPELYRAGRVERVYNFSGLNVTHAQEFAQELIADLLPKLPKGGYKLIPEQVEKAISYRFKNWKVEKSEKHEFNMTPARITELVYTKVKNHIAKNKI